jgi:hypothetical protein
VTVYTGTLEVIECTACGVTYGLTSHYQQHRRDDHKSWYCPNGHRQHYPQQSEAERLKDQLARERAQADQLKAARDGQARAAGRYRAERDRLRTRAQAGVCPCCNRTFKQLARHMKAKHPEQA